MNKRVYNALDKVASLDKEARVGKLTMLGRKLGLLKTPKGGLGFGNLLNNKKVIKSGLADDIRGLRIDNLGSKRLSNVALDEFDRKVTNNPILTDWLSSRSRIDVRNLRARLNSERAIDPKSFSQSPLFSGASIDNALSDAKSALKKIKKQGEWYLEEFEPKLFKRYLDDIAQVANAVKVRSSLPELQQIFNSMKAYQAISNTAADGLRGIFRALRDTKLK